MNTWPPSSFPTVCSTTSTSYGPTSLHDDLFTFLSNKAGHCRQGTIVAAVRSTRAEDVISILMQIPEDDRLAVKEVTLDLSSSMKDIVSTVFPNAIGGQFRSDFPVIASAYDTAGNLNISHELKGVPMKRNCLTVARGNFFFTADGFRTFSFLTD